MVVVVGAVRGTWAAAACPPSSDTYQMRPPGCTAGCSGRMGGSAVLRIRIDTVPDPGYEKIRYGSGSRQQQKI